jgi:hypothetical protein
MGYAAMKKYYNSLFILVLILAGCSGNNESSSSGESNRELKTDIPALYSTVTDINVQVFYEPEAEPYIGKTQNNVPYWTILEANIAELFSKRSLIPDIYVPRVIGEMKEIPKLNKTSWTPGDIMDMAVDFADDSSSSPEAKYFVFYIKGYLNEDGKDDISVIGASLSGTPIIVIFKDVVVSTGGTTMLGNYLEQATLVHEFGHAMGLVNNGVPVTSNHWDSENGKHHCKNPNCVMYWHNNGLSDLVEFKQDYLAKGDPVMFGPECLRDTAEYKP